jgi:hypothetical protein
VNQPVTIPTTQTAIAIVEAQPAIAGSPEFSHNPGLCRHEHHDRHDRHGNDAVDRDAARAQTGLEARCRVRCLGPA